MSRSDNGAPTLAEKAYQVIKRAILRGEIPEGAFLSEAEIGRRYGVGRTPLREACNRLHQQQLVELVPRHGFLVRGIRFQDVVDLFELRLLIEVASVDFAVARGTDAEIDELSGLTSVPGNVPATIEALIEANTRFHLSLAHMSRNAELVRTLAHLLEKYEALSYAETRNNKLTRESLEEFHRPIVNALQLRDAASAQQAMCRDMWNSHELILPHEPPASARAGVAEILGKAASRRRELSAE